MSIEIIGSNPIDLPLTFEHPRIYVRAQWGDPWLDITSLTEHVETIFSVCGGGLSKTEFKTRYGNLKTPGESGITYHPPMDIRDFWCMVTMVDPRDSVRKICFVGMIYNDTREIKGNSTTMIGEQPWTGYGPLKILQSIDISTSFWIDGGDEKEIGWAPGKNTRDSRKILVGNRSAERGTGALNAYKFGGTDIFTNLQYLEYLLENFVMREGGPTWKIAGATDVLDGIIDSTEFEKCKKLSEHLSKIIPRTYGLDYFTSYDETGFVLNVFSLLSDDSFFNETTMPKNPDTVRITRGDQIDLTRVSVVRSRDNMYDGFRVIGKRVVMCASFGGIDSGLDFNDLGPDWSSAIEAEYIAAGGLIDADEADKFRRKERYKSVYQKFAVPADWDHRSGTLSPAIGLDGTIQEEAAPFQNSVRKTLHWLPLFRDFDYSTNPPTNNTIGDAQPELQAPAAYIFDPDVNEESGAGYIECHLHSMSVSVPHDNLGVLINSSPNHVLALNHAFGSSDAAIDTTDHEPLYDYDTLSCTIAWECDAVLQVGYDVADEFKVGDGSIKKIAVDDAELWCLAPNTILGVASDGTLLLSDPNLGILRDDTPRLNLIAAGEIARYVNERVRSEFEYKGFLALPDWLGKIIEIVEADNANFVGAPLTAIHWKQTEKTASTFFRVGYAQ